jgi:hypothetical protein
MEWPKCFPQGNDEIARLRHEVEDLREQLKNQQAAR